MKITFKTLQQKQFQVDAEPSDTVGQLKEKVKDAEGHLVEQQKLIYAGKILGDDKTVESLGIKEKDFLVIMVSKPKVSMPASTSAAPAPAPAAAAPVPSTPVAPSPAPSTPATTAPAAPSGGAIVAEPDTLASSTPAVAAPGRQPSFGDSAFVTGSELDATVGNMMGMGFGREEVMRALKAGFNNPERAVEYLLNGIPEHLLAESAPSAPPGAAPGPATQNPASAAPSQSTSAFAPATATTPATGGGATAPMNLFAQAAAQAQGGSAPAGRETGVGAGAGAGGISQATLESLRSSPAFQNTIGAVRENPALLQPLIQQLAQANPTIAQQLRTNPELLYRLLGGIEGGVGEDQDDGYEGEGEIPPGVHIINVTQEEAEAIGRLEALGFPRELAMEAYFTCDKNEELAANYLFDNAFN